MTLDKKVRLIAGVLILISVYLTQIVDTRWFWFTAFIGFNLAQSAITGFCPMEMILKKIK